MGTYRTLGGLQPETTAVKNILAFHGVTAPHTGEPFSEAMLLGIAGGLGSMYILWEFERHGYPSIVLGFTYKTNYPVEFLQGLCARLGGGEHQFETAGKVKAEAQLEEILAGGDPAIAWVDLGGEPHYFHYLLAGVVVVYGIEGDQVLALDSWAVVGQGCATRAGQSYSLSFAYSPRPEAPQVSFEVRYAGVLKETITVAGGSRAAWVHKNYPLVGVSGSD